MEFEIDDAIDQPEPFFGETDADDAPLWRWDNEDGRDRAIPIPEQEYG